MVWKELLNRRDGVHVDVQVTLSGGGDEDELVDVFVRDLVEIAEREADGRQAGGGEIERKTDIVVGRLGRRPIAETSVSRHVEVFPWLCLQAG